MPAPTTESAPPSAGKRAGRTFMVALTYDATSSDALHFVVEELARDGDTIFCCSVAEQPAVLHDVPAGYHVSGFDETVFLEGKPQRRLRESAAQAVIDSGKRLELRYETELGETADAILEAAGRVRPDLLVVGAHAEKGLRGLFHTSVSHAVMQRSPVPVIVYHQPGHQ